MAGHSQFKNIMHKKGAADARRSKVFSKLAREITVAAKLGAPDPGMNPRLRLAIQNARAENMPKDNIERAIKKAMGGDAENYEEVRYEGYGPGRRRGHRRGADRQPQPHRQRRPLVLHQVRRGARRDRLGVVHVRPGRPDRLSARGRLGRRHARGGDQRRCRRRAERRDRACHHLRLHRSRRCGEEPRGGGRRGGDGEGGMAGPDHHRARRGQGGDHDEAGLRPR